MIRRTTLSGHRIVALPGAVIAVALLAGCAGSGAGVREKTSQEWYDQGARLAGDKKYDQALEAFREASKGYRGADLDADIQVALADTYFNQEEYPAAVEAYAEFLRLHPHSARADYAQFRIGLSWLKQMCSADRTPEPALKAVAAYEALLRGYPRSPLLDQGREGLAAARRRIAEHELEVADFYRRRQDYRAAASRYELVLRDYPDAGLGDRTLADLGSCYQKLGEPEKADQLLERKSPERR